MLSSAIYYFVRNIEQKADEARFGELANQRFNVVRINVSNALDSISILAAHFEVAQTSGTSRLQFKRMADPILDAHPFIQAIEWIPRVTPSTLDQFERDAHREGFENFQIYEKNAAGDRQPVATRPEYFPVYYVEPLSKNEKALGFDLASNSTRNVALRTAAQTTHITTSSRVTLVQEQGDQYGVLTFAPVYREGAE